MGPQLRSSEVGITLLNCPELGSKNQALHTYVNQSFIKCGPSWEGGRTLDKLIFSSGGNARASMEDWELSAGSPPSSWGIQSFILEGGSGLHIIASSYHPTGWNHDSLTQFSIPGQTQPTFPDLFSMILPISWMPINSPAIWMPLCYWKQ